ncbi:probable WRKY transcription factor 51 [Durio zibethinus]|uniref:Probable WRKY transcription factor 51 n=1 Tax=Durio zibethinus TaxID=66656 RepID=A0A6P5ZML3_DURZI|nr:probable WRKY transcription factor 51 [Durio zibethinus]
MSNSNVTTTFLAIAEAAATNIPQNPTPISTHTMDINSSDQQLQDFEDFLILAAADHEETKESTASSCLKASTTFSQNPFISSHDQNEMMTSSSVNDSCWEQVPRSSSADYNMEPNDDKKTMERDDDVGFKIAFRTKSDIEIMDDGYKWRKYGKKMVKNSPNPRNYYRCSSGGCKVKKRVERERDDPRFVITTYQGKHNHESLAPAPGHCTSHYALQILHQP